MFIWNSNDLFQNKKNLSQIIRFPVKSNVIYLDIFKLENLKFINLNLLIMHYKMIENNHCRMIDSIGIVLIIF